VRRRRRVVKVIRISFIDDEGRSFEVGFQEQASNHRKQLLSKAAVVSVPEKLNLNFDR